MDWKRFFVSWLKIFGISLGATTLSLGIFGLTLGGVDGFINGAIWGFTLGFLSLPFTAYIVYVKFWEGVTGRVGRWWLKRETEGAQEPCEWGKKLSD